MQTGSVSWTWDVTSGCLGALTAGNEAMVRDTVTGARLGPGEVGEICVKGATLSGALVYHSIWIS